MQNKVSRGTGTPGPEVQAQAKNPRTDGQYITWRLQFKLPKKWNANWANEEKWQTFI